MAWNTNPGWSETEDGLRPAEKFGNGDVALSAQASRFHYCTPRESGLPWDHYTKVELGMLGPDGLCLPSEVGVEGFDDLFESGKSPVAGYVTKLDYERLRHALLEKHGVCHAVCHETPDGMETSK